MISFLLSLVLCFAEGIPETLKYENEIKGLEDVKYYDDWQNDNKQKISDLNDKQKLGFYLLHSEQLDRRIIKELNDKAIRIEYAENLIKEAEAGSVPNKDDIIKSLTETKKGYEDDLAKFNELRKDLALKREKLLGGSIVKFNKDEKFNKELKAYLERLKKSNDAEKLVDRTPPKKDK